MLEADMLDLPFALWALEEAERLGAEADVSPPR